jgi:probable rRNA maturation factor
LKSKINFHSQDVPFSLKQKTIIKQWIKSIISSEKKSAGEITFVFCSDGYLHKMNLQYLNHDTLTDIITFDYTADNLISGDIFISIDRVKENAGKFRCSFARELFRVMSHGVLHLCGYKDKNKQQKELMRTMEDKALALLDPKLSGE